MRQEKHKKPNVVLGKDGQPLPEGPVNIGMGPSIIIPPEVEQRAGFRVETSDVARLISQFPQFKHFNTLI